MNADTKSFMANNIFESFMIMQSNQKILKVSIVLPINLFTKKYFQKLIKEF